MKINPVEVIQQKLAASMGFDRYGSIMNAIQHSDVSKDTDFQRTFNGFYMVRRNAEWRAIYYTLFEQIKRNDSISFSHILDELYEKTGNVEASFASKMLATIRPEMPIWDRYVVQNLGIKIPAANDSDRIEKTKRLYDDICKWYDEFLETENARECIEMFDKMLPDYTWLSPVKKIDFYLWSIR